MKYRFLILGLAAFLASVPVFAGTSLVCPVPHKKSKHAHKKQPQGLIEAGFAGVVRSVINGLDALLRFNHPAVPACHPASHAYAAHQGKPIEYRTREVRILESRMKEVRRYLLHRLSNNERASLLKMLRPSVNDRIGFLVRRIDHVKHRLEHEKLSEQDKHQLEDERKKLEAELSPFRRVRIHLFHLLYTLKEKDRQMVAMSWTAFGEARGTDDSAALWDRQSRVEELMPMNVIRNRAEILMAFRRQKKLRPIPKGKAYLDIALEPWQFSMYNLGDPNWVKAFWSPRLNRSDTQAVYDQTLAAYSDFQEIERQGSRKEREFYGSALLAATHYFARSLPQSDWPDWSQSATHYSDRESGINLPAPDPSSQWETTVKAHYLMKTLYGPEINPWLQD